MLALLHTKLSYYLDLFFDFYVDVPDKHTPQNILITVVRQFVLLSGKASSPHYLSFIEFFWLFRHLE